MDLETILRLVTAVTSIIGLYYGFKMFSLVRFTKYWTLAWGFFELTLVTLAFRRFYMLIIDAPCDALLLEVTAFTASLGVAIFVYLMHRFFVTYLGIHSKPSTLRDAVRDEVRDPIRDEDRDLRRDLKRDPTRDRERDKVRDEVRNGLLEKIKK